MQNAIKTLEMRLNMARQEKERTEKRISHLNEDLKREEEEKRNVWHTILDCEQALEVLKKSEFAPKQKRQ